MHEMSSEEEQAPKEQAPNDSERTNKYKCELGSTAIALSIFAGGAYLVAESIKNQVKFVALAKKHARECPGSPPPNPGHCGSLKQGAEAARSAAFPEMVLGLVLFVPALIFLLFALYKLVTNCYNRNSYDVIPSSRDRSARI